VFCPPAPVHLSLARRAKQWADTRSATDRQDVGTVAGKAKAQAQEARRIASSRPEHVKTPLPLRTNGVVTNVAPLPMGF
jgi:hypothetical protein